MQPITTPDFRSDLPKTKQDLLRALSAGKEFNYQGFISGVMSSWHPAEFVIDGTKYYNVEQYFMAMKAEFFNDKVALGRIQETRDPHRAKAIGRMVRNYDDSKWDEVRQSIMQAGHTAKYDQNPGMLKVLLETSDDILVECNSADLIWGAGIAMLDPRIKSPFEWPGENLLGFILMEIREEFNQKRAA